MKIAMMTNNYKPFVGGVPISIERLARGLRERGHEVCIFAPDYGQEQEKDVIRYKAGSMTLKNGMVIPNALDSRIRREFEEREFDLIHVHQPMLIGNVAMYLSRRYQIPLVFTYHTRYEEYLHYLKFFADVDETKIVRDYIMRQSKKLVPYYMRFYMKKCNMVFAPSTDIEKSIDRRSQVSVSTLPTGLADEAYIENPVRTEAIRKQYKEDGKYLLCTVSRLEKEKNLYFLLDAVKLLREKAGNTFRLMVVGEGVEKESLMAYAKKNGVDDIVSFTGNVPNEEVKDYLFASDMFLFSSTSETQGIVLAEAMAAGLPVAAVKACGVNDIVKDGINGCLTGEDREAYASKAAQMLEDERAMETMGRNALETAESYRISNIAARAERGYQQVLWQERWCAYEWEQPQKSGAVSSFLRLFKVS